MAKRYLYLLLVFCAFQTLCAQCPQIYNYLGNLSTRPYFVNCTGSSSYAVNFASNTSWGPYTIVWGDGTPNTTGASYTTPAIITHTYNSATPDTFIIQLIIPATNCTLTGIAVMEKPVNASIQIPVGGVTTACAPKMLSFVNSSTDVSETTWFTWNFGDGTPAVTYSYTNGGQTVTHTYNKGTVNCQTQVTLQARNYCTPAPTIANFNPIQIYDIDDAAITTPAPVKCWPDATFTLNNTTNRNCVPQGNTFQRQERWNLGDYWGLGHDSIVGWRPWPPTAPIVVTYTAVGTYTAALLDSNLCGIDGAVVNLTIVNPPTAGVVGPSTVCAGTAATFTNTSATGYAYKWNFGDGGGFVTRPFGPQSNTYNTAGTYTVKVVALITGAGAACTDTDQVVINVLPRPTANFSVTPNKGCDRLLGVVFTDNSSATANTWAWNFGNSSTFVGQNPPPQNYTTVGNFVASLTVTATNNCTNTYTAPVQVFQTPTASFTAGSACVGVNIPFTDQSLHAPGDPITTWKWDFGDAAPTSTVSAPTHSYNAPNTYTVTFIAATANCRDTIQQPVTINVKPTAGYTLSPLNGCPPLAVTFTNTSINGTGYTWKFGDGATSTLTNTAHSFTNNTTGNKTYTVTLIASTGLGCSDSTKHQVTVFAKPTSSFVAAAPIGCSPLPATFTNTSVGATTYNWDFGDLSTSTSTATVLSHTFTNNSLLLQTFTVQLIATSSNGCKDTSRATISSYPKPIFNFTMTPGSGCTPLAVNFPPVLGAVSYTWNFGDGSPIQNGSNPTHVFTNTTTANHTYTVQLIAENAFSCRDTTYGYPLVSPKPLARFTPTLSTGCTPLPITYTNTSVAATSYTWNYGDGSAVSTTTNAAHTFTNGAVINQSYTVQLVAQNSFGCRDTARAPVTVSPKPLAGFSYTPATGCSPFPIAPVNQSLGSTTYTWNFGDGTPLLNTTNPTHVFVNTTVANQNFTVSLIAGNSFGCSDTAYLPTVVLPKPTAAFTPTINSGCSPLAMTFTNTSVASTTYTWDYGDATPTTTVANVSHTFTNGAVSNQSYTVQLISRNSYNCTDTAHAVITVSPKPLAGFSYSPTVGCSPLTVSHINQSLGSTTYTWNYGDGTPNGTAINPIHTYTNTTAATKIFTITLISGNSFSCTDTTIANLIVYAKPTANFNYVPISGCSPVTVSYTNTSTQASAYDWSFTGGSVSTQTNVSMTFSNSTNTTDQIIVAKLVAKTPQGCRDSISQPVTVFYKPKAGFAVDTPACSPRPLNFTNTSLGASSYLWDFGNGAVSSATNATQPYVNAGPGNLTFTVQLVAVSPNNCKDTIRVPVSIHPKPEFNITAVPDTGCTPLTVNFPAIPGVSTYQWAFGDGSADVGPNVSNIYYNNTPSDKTYTVQLIATDSYGCRDTSTKTIRVYAKPIALFQVNPNTVFVPNTAMNTSNLSSGAVGYEWHFGDGNTSTLFEPVYYYQQQGEYQIFLIATNAHGCRDTFNLPSKVNAQLESTVDIPNAFTPNPNGSNGGGYGNMDTNNDVFHPVIRGVDKYELNIFSRWGELLFVSKDVNIGWDGYYKGKLCTQDVYIWKIVATTIDGKPVNKTGDVLLLR